MVMNEWRKKKLAFVKLFQSQMVVSVHKDRFGEFKETSDLQGKEAAVMENSSYHNWIEKNNQSTFSNNPVQFIFMKTCPIGVKFLAIPCKSNPSDTAPT